MKSRKKRRGIEAMSRRAGRLFILPWEIGMVFFVIVPLLISVAYAFCEVAFKVGGMDYHFVFLDNFKYLLKEDPYYSDTLVSSLTSILYTIPIIVAVRIQTPAAII